MNVLVISQHLFPIKTPRAHRTTELVKELARQGHKVTVYAVLGKHDYSSFEREFNVEVKNIPIRFQKIPYSSDGDGRRAFIDKVSGRILGKVFEFPYIEFMYNIPGIIKKEKKHDVLISISEPHHVHWGCANAKLKYPSNFPVSWIADSGDPFMNNGSTRDHLHCFAKYERKFCSLCDFITVPVTNAIDGYYPEFRHKIRVIPQGFDFETPVPQPDPCNATVTFAFAGMFYKDIRNPKLFLDYISSINADFKFVVYTPHRELLHDYEDKLGSKLEIKSPIDRLELIENLKRMDFFLNIENANSPNQTPSKLIDYAIAGRPILSINPTNIDKELIDRFIARNYTGQLVIGNVKQYRISNVVEQFLSLVSESGKIKDS